MFAKPPIVKCTTGHPQRAMYVAKRTPNALIYHCPHCQCIVQVERMKVK